jgi:hypothetical protein
MRCQVNEKRNVEFRAVLLVIYKAAQISIGTACFNNLKAFERG